MRRLRSDWNNFKTQNKRATNQGLLGSGIFLLIIAIFTKSLILGVAIPVVGLIAFLIPKLKDLIAFTWWALGVDLGRITSPIILGIFFYMILTPWSLLFRIFNPDSLKLNRQLKTQLQDKRHVYKAADFDNPF